jgi:hypothetical protein
MLLLARMALMVALCLRAMMLRLLAQAAAAAAATPHRTCTKSITQYKEIGRNITRGYQVIDELFVCPCCLPCNRENGLPHAAAAAAAKLLSQLSLIFQLCVANPPIESAYRGGIQPVVSTHAQSVTFLYRRRLIEGS